MSRTREKALTPATRQQNATMFGGDAGRVPARALTMGVGTILDGRELLLLATGAAKAAVLAKAVEGKRCAMALEAGRHSSSSSSGGYCGGALPMALSSFG